MARTRIIEVLDHGYESDSYDVGIKILIKRNPIAKILKFFTPKIIRDKKKYTRKIKYSKKNQNMGSALIIKEPGRKGLGDIKNVQINMKV